VTPLESDTLLGYIFAHYFSDLEAVFNKFKTHVPPFMLSNGFVTWTLPKPYIQLNIDKSNQNSLVEDMISEVARKNNKDIKEIPCEKKFLKFYLSWEEKIQEEVKDYIQDIQKYFGKLHEDGSRNELYQENFIETIDFKNSIPRFDIENTTPYALDEIKRYDGKCIIFVSIFHDWEKDFDLFFASMKKTFLNLGRGKYKSKGYGNIKDINIWDLNKNEKEVFDLIDEQQTNWQYYILNNYKPSQQDLDHLDEKKSYYSIHHKNATSWDNSDNPFKGTMHFFAPWSVLQFKNGYTPKWDNYESVGVNHTRYNFGFIF
jgi:hypothetical protein